MVMLRQTSEILFPSLCSQCLSIMKHGHNNNSQCNRKVITRKGGGPTTMGKLPPQRRVQGWMDDKEEWIGSVLGGRNLNLDQQNFP